MAEKGRGRQEIESGGLIWLLETERGVDMHPQQLDDVARKRLGTGRVIASLMVSIGSWPFPGDHGRVTFALYVLTKIDSLIAKDTLYK